MNTPVHNDFHNAHGIFPLFDGLQVPDMEKPLHSTGNGSGKAIAETVGTDEAKQNGDASQISEKTPIAAASDAVKSAASAITNGLSSLTVAN